MQTSMIRSCVLVVFSLALCSCNKSVSEPGVTPEPAAAPATVDSGAMSADAGQSLSGGNGMLSAKPGVASCDGTDVAFSWDVSAQPTTQSVEVWVGEGDDAVLFAAGGAQGQQSSGPWVKPGSTFVLRNKANNEELDRLTIGGNPCAAPVPAPTQ